MGAKKLLSSITPVQIDFPKVTQIKAIGAGRVHSLAVTNDGLYAWGDNSQGQLGLGAFDANSCALTPAKVPQEVTAIAAVGGDHHTFVLQEGTAGVAPPVADQEVVSPSLLRHSSHGQTDRSLSKVQMP